jgi:ABC-type Fe3+-siderophore transport system permease subunit
VVVKGCVSLFKSRIIRRLVEKDDFRALIRSSWLILLAFVFIAWCWCRALTVAQIESAAVFEFIHNMK